MKRKASAAISLAERKARSLPQRRDSWVVAVRRAPTWIQEDPNQPPQRPWAVLVVSSGSGQIRSAEMLGEHPAPEVVLEHVLRAMGRPLAGAHGKYRPDHVAAEDPECATVLKTRLKPLGVRVSCPGPVAAMDELLAHLQESFDGRPPMAGLLHTEGVTAAAVERFCSAAARFHRAAPWRTLSDADWLEVRVPPAAQPWYATVLGGGGEVFGLALYRDWKELEQLWAGDGGPATAEQMRSVAVWYSTAQEVPFADLDALEQHRWEVDGPEAYPVAIRVDPDDERQRPDGGELQILTDALEGVAQIFEELPRDGTLPYAPVPISLSDGREGALEIVAEEDAESSGGPAAGEMVDSFIHGWHRTPAQQAYAREAGAFLLAFLLDYLWPKGYAEATWNRHQDNTWYIGAFATAAAQPGDAFTPEVFSGPVKFESAFRTLASPAPTRLKQYRATWKHLQDYLGTLRERSLF